LSALRDLLTCESRIITEVHANGRFGDWHATCSDAASADAVMWLPFTHDQFVDVFAAYNGALRPCVVALWSASW